MTRMNEFFTIQNVFLLEAGKANHILGGLIYLKLFFVILKVISSSQNLITLMLSTIKKTLTNLSDFYLTMII